MYCVILYGNAWFRTVAGKSVQTPSIPQAHGVAGLGPLIFLYLTSVTAFVLRLFVLVCFKDVCRVVQGSLCLTSRGTCLPPSLITLLQKYVTFSSQNRDQILSAGHGGCVYLDVAGM